MAQFHIHPREMCLPLSPRAHSRTSKDNKYARAGLLVQRRRTKKEDYIIATSHIDDNILFTPPDDGWGEHISDIYNPELYDRFEHLFPEFLPDPH